MKKAQHFLFLGLLGVAPLAAADLSYTYLGAGYVIDGEVDGINVDLDGFSFAGSFAVGENFYILGNAQMLETDPGDADVDRIDLGAGFHTPIAPGMDFDGSLAYSDVEIGRFDGDGFQLRGGVRGKPNEFFEWGAHLVYEDLDFDDLGSDSDVGYDLNARYFFSGTLSAGLNLRDVSDIETMTINVRFDF
ncbi:hypothetical protein ACXYTJ_15970 [Gilvimarinus sp. F26214L]|uniref:hypothetical protein n=1 Tax=Gilvimarinus sp. DZF01 TaxID=3461371 RepID=UPI0040462FD9